MRHPVDLVLQVVARACWALESTASRPKKLPCEGAVCIRAVGSSRWTFSWSRQRSPVRATLAALAVSSSHPGTMASPRAGESSLRSARLFLSRTSDSKYSTSERAPTRGGERVRGRFEKQNRGLGTARVCPGSTLFSVGFASTIILVSRGGWECSGQYCNTIDNK